MRILWFLAQTNTQCRYLAIIFNILKDRNVDLFETKPKWLRRAGTVVEHAPRYPQVKGSSPAVAAAAGRGIIGKISCEPP